MVVGGAFGAVAARKVKMTAMPQMVALFNGVGGGAAALVSLSEFHNRAPLPGHLHGDISLAIVLSALIGSISFAGSMVAFGKLQELDQRPADHVSGPAVRQRRCSSSGSSSSAARSSREPSSSG